MARNYTAIPHAYLEECEGLSDAEFGGLIRALLRYSRSGEPIEAEGNARFFARRMMNQEDFFRKSFEKTAGKRSEAGKKGAVARWGDGAADKNGNCHHKDKEKEKEKEKESYKDRKKEEKESKPPVLPVENPASVGKSVENPLTPVENGGFNWRFDPSRFTR